MQTPSCPPKAGARALQPDSPQNDRWRPAAHRRLSRLLENALRLPIDDASRILFLSDCHRGDGGPADDLWPNRRLYHDVLARTYQQGFAYIEVGDGDELWKNRQLAPIRQAHRPVYDLLQAFHRQNRLHLIMGNHDYAGLSQRTIAKEGIPARKALVLQHRETGLEMLVAHGHQVDFERDPGLAFSRLGVRYFWRGLQQRGYWRSPNWTEMAHGPSWLGRIIARSMLKRNKIVKARLTSWLVHLAKSGQPAADHGPALLCGHTHEAWCAAPSEPAYFNTGCCIVPGQITGIELQAGQLSLIKWTDNDGLERERLAGPRPLADLCAPWTLS